MKNFDQFIVSKNTTIRNALKKIDDNKNGFVLIKDFDNKIIAISTDGDIRRELFKNQDINQEIETCANKNFMFFEEGISHEFIYKNLSNKFKAIPVLNKNRELVNIITKKNIPDRIEQKFYARSKSPVRISFGGGGSDTSNFIKNYDGAVINSTISLYSHSTLIKREDQKIFIESQDLNDCVEFENLRELKEYKGNFELIISLIKTIKPKFGFNLYIKSDFPKASGLGGSSSVLSSIIGCFNEFKINKWTKYEMSEIIFEAERINLGFEGGWQDQYATVFGGFNLIEFKDNENLVIPLKLSKESILELEQCLILCYTNSDHGSFKVHDDQKKNVNEKKIIDNILKNVKLTYEMRDVILKSNFLKLGKLLHETWKLKKTFSSKISNSYLDNIYSNALNNGAIGGKLLGAGGGGFFIFFVPFNQKFRLINWIKKNKNIKMVNFQFEENGLQAWRHRI